MSKGSSHKEFEAFLQCLKESTGQLSHGELALTLEGSFYSAEEETDRAVMTVSHKQETPTFVLGKRKAQSEAEHVQHQKRKRCRNVLPSQPPVFVGRQDKITEVVKNFKGGQHILTLTGLPGIGKTTLAIAAAHEIILSSSDMITVYIPLRSIKNVSDVPSLILKELSVGGLDKADAKKRLLVWIKQLQSCEETLLLVLDNVDDLLEADQVGFVHLIQEMQNTSENIYLLFTSRKKFGDPSLDIRNILVSPLDLESASEMICQLSPSVDSKESNQLATLCGCLPLALKLVGSLLNEGICKSVELISDLEKSRSSKMDTLKDDTFTDDWQIQAVIKTSIDKLNNDHSKVLTALGVFPGCFKKTIAIKVLTDVVEFQDKDNPTRRAIQRTIQSLCNRSLLDYNPLSQQLQIHPLIQSYLEHTSTSDPQLDETWKNSEQTFTRCYIEMCDQLCNMYWSKDGAKHALEDFDDERMNIVYVLNRPIPKEHQFTIMQLLEDSFLFFRISMGHENISSLISNCKSIAQQVYGYSSLQSLFFQLLKAVVLGLKGDMRVVSEMKTSQEELEKYDGKVTTITNDKEALLCIFVGLFYLIKRDYNKAPQFVTLSIEWLVKNSPESRLLGFAHRMFGVTGQQNTTLAIDHCYKALVIQESTLGENPETMIIYLTIGSALLRGKQYEKSIHCLLSSYRMSVNLGLNEHEDTVIVLTSLGEAYRCTDKHNEAIVCLQKAFKVIEKIGVYRTSIWTYKFMARILRDQEKWTAAIEYMDQGLKASHESFYQQHDPHVTDISIDKAKIYADNLGMLLEALQLHLDCLLHDKQFGVPVTGKGRNKLLSREVDDYDVAFDELASKIDISQYEYSVCIKANRLAAEIYQQKGDSMKSQFHLDAASNLEQKYKIIS
ncbi:uncharacterized protein [Dysidea avara]